MKLLFLAVGKAHEPYVKPGVDDFTRRAGNYYPAAWQIIAPPKNAGNLGGAELKKKEGELILNTLADNDYLVALDEKGRQLSSAGLATFLQDRANESTRQLVFLIGGAYGLDAAVLKKARFTWSLSDLTFPHQLVRLILAEQVYRACTIQRNEKYHHQ